MELPPLLDLELRVLGVVPKEEKPKPIVVDRTPTPLPALDENGEPTF